MPITNEVDYYGTSNVVRRSLHRNWHTQKKPYVKALPYSMSVENGYSSKEGISQSGASQVSASWIAGAARNAAISNLQSKLQVAQLGNALGEYKSSANMIASRAKQLTQAYRDVRRGRLADAASTLGMTRPKRTRAKSAAGIWLEYHYGWSPLISDAYSSSKIFRHPQQPKVMRFSGRSKRRTTSSSGIRTRDFQEFDWRPNPDRNNKLEYVAIKDCRYTLQYDYVMEASAEAVCHLRDVTALQRLQLDNPAMVAWEVMPFSFIADWFFPVGTYITSLSPAFRRNVVSSSVSTKIQCDTTAIVNTVWDRGRDGPARDEVDKVYPSKMGDSFSFGRSIGLAISPTMDRSFLQGDSFLRAGHAIALLVSAFRS